MSDSTNSNNVDEAPTTSESNIISDGNNFDPNAGRRLLTSSYRDFPHPADLGDRYAAFLLRNERTTSTLQRHVMMDHWTIVRELSGGDVVGHNASRMMAMMTSTQGDGAAAANNNNNGGGGEPKTQQRHANASIEIDAFQLLNLDPVLGHLTLRYPDTLLELLEDATVQARQVLRRRIEVAMQQSLDKMKRHKSDMRVKIEDYKREVNSMIQLLNALKHTGDKYEPRPLHARLVHLPPHTQFCQPTLSSLASSDVGTVIQISGTCVRTGPIRMMETVRTYKCLGKSCGHTFSVNADFGTANNALPMPTICPRADMDGECQSTSFAIVPNGSEHADYQEMKVQESASALNRVGSVPRSLSVKLSDDLVDGCNPGDEVVVVGCLHATWQSQGLAPNVEVMVGMSMRAHSVRVINVDEEFGGGGGGGGGNMADLGLMGGGGGGMASSGNLREKFRREFDVFWSDATSKQHPMGTRDYIVRAVCPKLYGMHAVKLGLLLVLIGGANVSSSSSTANDEGGVEGALEEEEGGGNIIGATPSNEEINVDSASDEEAPVAFKIGGDDENDNFAKQDKKRARATKKKSNNKNTKAIKSRRRIQSHILLIGDPGTGKSQFLRFAAALAPRSVLTTGTGSSTAGLTCAAVRDSSGGSSNGGNEFSLEAGALALADRGVCCIDEFGCMSKEDRTSIHEAMEQQTISVAKAGIICKLNARATVVAVMNPNGGIYENELTIEQNSRLGTALLSRFDLIFVMLDQAELGKDTNIAQFLLQQSLIPGSGYDRPLDIETQFNDDNVNGFWSMEKLRAYIATIREKFHPTLTPEASELLENHYSKCRQANNGRSLITVRFLESLIRLSQAHARLMYRDKVLLDDAVAVILLMDYTAASCVDDMMYGSIDTEFRPFNDADAIFQDEKETLLQTYPNPSPNNDVMMSQQSNGGFPPPYHPDSKYKSWGDFERREVHSFGRNGQGRNTDRQEDQLGRRMSQASPHPSTKKNSIGRAMETMDAHQYTPVLNRDGADQHSSEKRVTFSQQNRYHDIDDQGNVHQSVEMNSNTSISDGGYHSSGKTGDQYDRRMSQQQDDGRFGNDNQQYSGHISQQQQEQDFPPHVGGNPNAQFFDAPPEHKRPRSGGFLREDDRGYDTIVRAGTFTQQWEMGRPDQNVPLSQQVYNFEQSSARAHHGNHVGQGGPNAMHISQQSSSGKRRKKRRSAD